MNIFVVSVALLTRCNLATFLLSLPSNLMTEKRDARRESPATNKTTLLTVADSSVEQKNAPKMCKELLFIRIYQAKNSRPYFWQFHVFQRAYMKHYLPYLCFVTEFR
jgi:hypothetical protein